MFAALCKIVRFRNVFFAIFQIAFEISNTQVVSCVFPITFYPSKKRVIKHVLMLLKILNAIIILKRFKRF